MFFILDYTCTCPNVMDSEINKYIALLYGIVIIYPERKQQFQTNNLFTCKSCVYNVKYTI